MKSWQHTLIGVFCGLILSGAILLIALPPRGRPVELLPVPSPAPVSIHVSGAVLNPGVYQLPQGSRVEDAVIAAGGALDEANLQEVNLAARLKDGEKISVPFAGESAQISTSKNDSFAFDESPAESGGLVNLNTATLEELQSLPGIGETRAKAIITYRENNAGFKSIEEIQKVPGIGPVIYERLKDLITVE